MERPQPSKSRKRRREVACVRCHTYKIKCSGERPCHNCSNSTKKVACVYPVKDRKVQVSEQYLKKLQSEVDSLRSQVDKTNNTTAQVVPAGHEGTTCQPTPARTDDSALANPLVAECSQLVHTQFPTRPVYLGDASGIAFGMRLRQLVRRREGKPDTLRTQHRYFQSPGLLRQKSVHFELPERPYALILVEMVKRFLGTTHHLRLGPSFLARLDSLYATGTEDPIWICRLFLLFALGELYSNNIAKVSMETSESQIPGTSFFMTAVSLMQDLYEEATVLYVEALMLASLYSDALNRTNSAYAYIGLALRVSLTLGLHRTIKSPHIPPAEREHRNRVWWTLHYLERLCSSKLGHPMMLGDEDISTTLPSWDGLSEAERVEFPSPAILIAQLRLAKIVGSIMRDMYTVSRKEPRQSILPSVQGIFAQLKEWNERLPEELKLNASGQGARHVYALHLLFNQCVILATRPILFLVFQYDPRISRQQETGDKAPRDDNSLHMPPIATVLAKHCIQAAQNIHRILVQLWIGGSIAMCSYTDAIILFTSTMVLMLALKLEIDASETDNHESVGTMWRLLQSMCDHGNKAAMAFHEQLELLSQDLRLEWPGRLPRGRNVTDEHDTYEGQHLVEMEHLTGPGLPRLGRRYVPEGLPGHGIEGSSVLSPTLQLPESERENGGVVLSQETAQLFAESERWPLGIGNDLAESFYFQADSMVTPPAVAAASQGEAGSGRSAAVANDHQTANSLSIPGFLATTMDMNGAELCWDWTMGVNMDDMDGAEADSIPFLWE